MNHKQTRKIAVLDKDTIDKIAAGEVVERPSSVVKELVENAIDAGALAITAEIKEGGISFLRITDNGTGMEKDEIPLAFCRHATSKIQKAEDLEQIGSLGFRGEALSSIAAVSQVEVISKTPFAMTGSRYVIEGGAEKSLEEVGSPDGTTILVHNLFYNVPARKKFLKTAATEGGYVSTLMERLALSHPEISFKYMVNGQLKLQTTGNNQMKDVIYQIYGRDVAKQLLPIAFKNEFLDITGYLGKPSVSRGNRGFENYFINGRYVKDSIVTRALEDGFHGYTMQHKYPFAVLQIQMSGNDLDVNVHPSKMQIRFSKGEEVYQAILHGVKETLGSQELIPDISLENKGEKKKKPEKKEEKVSSRPKVTAPEPFEVERKARMGDGPQAPQAPPRKRPVVYSQIAGQEQTVTVPEPVIKEEQMELFAPGLLTEEARSRHILIGQVFGTYWLVEYEEKFYIIDQHAAHEKVLYQNLMKGFHEKKISSQYLSPPLIVTVDMGEELLLLEHMGMFQKLGFEIEPFGTREYSVHAVPADLYSLSGEVLFKELLDSLDKEKTGQDLEIFAQRLASLACKGAVKGNHALSSLEADRLIGELLALENPYHCPHGRPTIVSMSRAELEKMFKRIV